MLSGVEEFMELAVLQPSDIADLDLSAAWRWIRFPQRKSETEMKEAICVDVPRVPVAHVQGVEGQPWVLGDRMKWAIASDIREWRNGDAEASWYLGLHSTISSVRDKARCAHFCGIKCSQLPNVEYLEVRSIASHYARYQGQEDVRPSTAVDAS